MVELASALELDEPDIRGAAAAVAEACALPLPAARIILFGRAAGDPRLLELPPLLAAETQLNLLLGLDVLAEVSLWKRTPGGLECMLSLGASGEPSRRVRAEAKAVLRGRSRLRSWAAPIPAPWPCTGSASAPPLSSAGSDRSRRRS